MAIDPNQIPDYSDAQLLKAARYAAFQLSFSESTEFAGRKVQRSALPDMQEYIKWLEARIAAASNTDGGFIALAVDPTSGYTNGGECQ